MEENVYTYKEYAVKHFGRNYNLGALCVPHFHPDAYSDRVEYDTLAKLELYLAELAPFAKVLSKAARLRQQHYERYLQRDGSEDDGHRYWRVAMNEIAADARRKLEMWSAHRDCQLDEAIARYVAEPLPRVFQLTSRLVNPEPEAKTKRKPKKRVCRPPLSKAEKRRRTRERQRATEALLQEAMQEARQQEQRVISHVFLKMHPASRQTPPISPFYLTSLVEKCRENKNFHHLSRQVDAIGRILCRGMSLSDTMIDFLMALIEAANHVVHTKMEQMHCIHWAMVSIIALSRELGLDDLSYLSAVALVFQENSIGTGYKQSIIVAPLLGSVSLKKAHYMLKYAKLPEECISAVLHIYAYGWYRYNELVYTKTSTQRRVFSLNTHTNDVDMTRDFKFRGYNIMGAPDWLVETVDNLRRK